MSRTLLLADDSAAVRRVIELTFAAEDIRIVAVTDGEQAIQRIPAERPDVVVASIETARRSGYDVAAFVTSHPSLSHVPVLLLASAFEPVDEARVRQVKAAGVLVKPFDPRQVIARVRDLVDGGTRSPATPESPIPNPEPRFRESRVPNPESPIPSPEPAVPDPQSRTPAARATSSLDDYFERLDAALTSRAATRAPSTPPVQTSAGDDESSTKVPLMDEILGADRPDPS